MRGRTFAVCVPAVLFIASLAAAQFRRAGDTSIDAHLARPDSYDAQFHYCRAVYRPNPRGEVAVSFDGPGQPRHLIVQCEHVSVEGAPSFLRAHRPASS